jgi:alcohol dehydrogenase class IV
MVAPRLAFELAAPTRIVFGAGCAREVGALAAGLGGCALVVTGKSTDRAAAVLAALAAAGVRATTFSVAGEPTVETARAGVAAARAESCDLVIAFGGGSTLDAGKAIATLVANGGDPFDYLEVVGRGQPLTRRSLPFIAMPTTAGTGSEVTKNAVLGSREHGKGGKGGKGGMKASLRSPLMLPSLALVDPDLLVGLPAEVLASSGLDALSQLIEPFVSARANPLTDGFAARTRPRGWGSSWRRPIASRSRWPACSAASAWRTPGSAPCTASPLRSAGSSTLRTVRSVPPCSDRSCRSTWRRCAPAIPRVPRWSAIRRWRRS